MLRCYDRILQLNNVEYEAMLTSLYFERLNRKHNDIIEILQRRNLDWNETFYTMLLRVLGGMENRGAMLELSERVSCRMVMRENSSLVTLESLLLGAAGLLDIYHPDDYINRLRLEFDHLSLKYDIIPMLPGEWNLNSYYRANHPTLRIAQLAACLHNRDFNIQTAIACRNSSDIYDFFRGNASEYWINNFLPKSKVKQTTYRIGHLKSDLLGINLIAPMMYTYGNYINSEDIVCRSITLLESITAEFNRYTKPWYNVGIEPRNAFVSQALIQLSKEYCAAKRCEACPLSRHFKR